MRLTLRKKPAIDVQREAPLLKIDVRSLLNAEAGPPHPRLSSKHHRSTVEISDSPPFTYYIK